MSLSQSQRSLIEKARHVGKSDTAVPLDDGSLSYILARIIHDLALHDQYPEVPREIPPFFETWPVSSLNLKGLDFDLIAERLFTSIPDTDTYFSCLTSFLKARLKFERILQRQSFPTMDQVGPRGLLQYGSLPVPALAGLLYWRKWLYDTDNRAAQETGYLFEPILATVIGGTPVSAKRSPIKRIGDDTKGRQVDCLKGRKAYEFKLRVTTAASGQGRWQEELSFPADCVRSHYVPVLIVLDPTDNLKLTELVSVFHDAGGSTYIGDAAWALLEAEAGQILAQFLERYIRSPLDSLISHAPDRLPTLELHDNGSTVRLRVGDEILTIARANDDSISSDYNSIPEDVDDAIPGV